MSADHLAHLKDLRDRTAHTSLRGIGQEFVRQYKRDTGIDFDWDNYTREQIAKYTEWAREKVRLENEAVAFAIEALEAFPENRPTIRRTYPRRFR